MSVLLAMFSAIAQGMLWAMLALGVYITFRLLDFADLTCEGSFAMGACISAVMTVTYHMNPFISLIFGFLGGAIAGTVTGLLNTKLKIPPILAGILSMISLYSINLRIMSDKANLPINVREEGVESMVTLVQKLLPESIRTMSQTTTVIAACIGVIFCVLSVAVLYWFFGTELGSAIRATGNNEKMIRAAIGKTGDSALKLVAVEYLNYMIEHPGVYEIIQWASWNGTEETAIIFNDYLSLLKTLICSCGFNPDKTTEILSMVTGMLHGYTTLQLRYAFSNPDKVRKELSEAIDTLLLGANQKYKD